MQLLEEIGYRLGQVAPRGVAAAAVVYFAFHAVQGERGLMAHKRLSEELQQTRALAEQVAEERARWEPRSLVAAEDRSRYAGGESKALLNYLRDDEVVIYLLKSPINL